VRAATAEFPPELQAQTPGTAGDEHDLIREAPAPSPECGSPQREGNADANQDLAGRRLRIMQPCVGAGRS
jgi:hypothetical protein